MFSMISCPTTSDHEVEEVQLEIPEAPSKPDITFTGDDETGRVYLSIQEAKALGRYFNEVEAYEKEVTDLILYYQGEKDEPNQGD